VWYRGGYPPEDLTWNIHFNIILPCI
jgi:hypothetical protein